MHTEMACKRLEMTFTGEENVKKNPDITNVGTFLVTFRFFARRDVFAFTSTRTGENNTKHRENFAQEFCIALMYSDGVLLMSNHSLTRSVRLKCGRPKNGTQNGRRRNENESTAISCKENYELGPAKTGMHP